MCKAIDKAWLFVCWVRTKRADCDERAFHTKSLNLELFRILRFVLFALSTFRAVQTRFGLKINHRNCRWQWKAKKKARFDLPAMIMTRLYLRFGDKKKERNFLFSFLLCGNYRRFVVKSRKCSEEIENWRNEWRKTRISGFIFGEWAVGQAELYF